jgi:hypothetical protein
MVLPTLQWLTTNLTGSLGSFLAWDGITSVDAEAMVNELLDLIKVYVPSTTSFNLATVYNQATSTSDNIPARSVGLSKTGTSGATGFSQAQSATFNFKTTANGDAKIVLLDAPLGSGGFIAVHPPAFSPDDLALEAGFGAVNRAWSGRDDARPSRRAQAGDAAARLRLPSRTARRQRHPGKKTGSEKGEAQRAEIGGPRAVALRHPFRVLGPRPSTSSG